MNIDALKASWAAAEQLGPAAAKYFYATLFTIAPELRGMFPPSMAGQNGKLLAALGRVVSNVDNPDVLAAFAGQLGEDHRRFDVQPEHFPLVGQALIHTLEVHLGAAGAWTPELAADWGTAYGVVSDLMIQAAKVHAETQPAYWDAPVVEHERRGPDIAIITVRPEPQLRIRAGKSLAVESPRRPRVWRHYSPANADRPREGTIDFHVRSVPGGELSTALVRHTRRGDVLRLGAPVGERLTVSRGGPDLLMIASGTGVAPFQAVIEQLAADLDDRRVTLVVGTADGRDPYNLPELLDLAERYRRVTVVPAGGQPPVTVALAGGQTWHDRQVYVCGGRPMVSETCSVLLAEGYAPNDVHVEAFDGTTYVHLQSDRSPEEVFRKVTGQ